MSTARAKICIIIGDPVAHSVSPAFHSAGYRALGLETEYVFGAAQVAPADLVRAIDGARALGLHAITCTMPHKEAVIPLLDELDDAARAIGAVNSIVQRSGRLIGYNTDWIGVTAPLSARRDLAGVNAVVIGAGGTARAAVYGLRERGARVTVLNRTVKRAADLAAHFGCAYGALTASARLREADVVVQTTAVGFGQSGALPIDGTALRSGQLVIDVVYRPRMTPFLLAAQGVGAQVVSGEEVFIEQGLAQFELYTGQRPPRRPLEEVVWAAP